MGITESTQKNSFPWGPSKSRSTPQFTDPRGFDGRARSSATLPARPSDASAPPGRRSRNSSPRVSDRKGIKRRSDPSFDGVPSNLIEDYLNHGIRSEALLTPPQTPEDDYRQSNGRSVTSCGISNGSPCSSTDIQIECEEKETQTSPHRPLPSRNHSSVIRSVSVPQRPAEPRGRPTTRGRNPTNSRSVPASNVKGDPYICLHYEDTFNRDQRSLYTAEQLAAWKPVLSEMSVAKPMKSERTQVVIQLENLIPNGSSRYKIGSNVWFQPDVQCGTLIRQNSDSSLVNRHMNLSSVHQHTPSQNFLTKELKITPKPQKRKHRKSKTSKKETQKKIIETQFNRKSPADIFDNIQLNFDNLESIPGTVKRKTQKDSPNSLSWELNDPPASQKYRPTDIDEAISRKSFEPAEFQVPMYPSGTFPVLRLPKPDSQPKLVDILRLSMTSEDPDHVMTLPKSVKLNDGDPNVGKEKLDTCDTSNIEKEEETGCNLTCHEQCQEVVSIDCKGLFPMDSDSNPDEDTEEIAPVAAPAAGAGEKHEEETQEKDLPKLTSQNSQDESTLRRTVARIQSEAVVSSEIEEWVQKCSSTDQSLQIAKEPDGSYRGCLRIHLNLSRPINIVAGTRPPSIYDILQEDRTMERTLTSFYMPRDAVKAIHITSTTTTREVIVALLKKFKVVDNPQKFALYEKSCDPGQSSKATLRKLVDTECPLVLAITWGAQDLTNKRLVLQENDTADIQWDAFSLPELDNFLRILDKEEEEYKNQIRDKYSLLRKRMNDRLYQLAVAS